MPWRLAGGEQSGWYRGRVLGLEERREKGKERGGERRRTREAKGSHGEKYSVSSVHCSLS